MSAYVADRMGAPLVFIAVLVVLGAYVGIGYARGIGAGDIGLTTEIAALLTYLIGAIAAAGELTIAAASAVRITTLLTLSPGPNGWCSRSTPRTSRPPSASPSWLPWSSLCCRTSRWVRHDAITLSMAELSRGDGSVSPDTAANAIVIAAATNILVKGAMIWFLGNHQLRRLIGPVVVATVIVTLALTFVT